MRIDAAAGFVGFKVIDDATGKPLAYVTWVDDATLEYAVISQPPRLKLGTDDIVEDVVKVTRVAMNYPAREIHVNEPMFVWSGVEVRELHKCDACCQEGACRRIDYCVRYKCGFGEAKQP